jgi:hypothetical protein
MVNWKGCGREAIVAHMPRAEVETSASRMIICHFPNSARKIFIASKFLVSNCKTIQRRDSTAGIATGYGLDGREFGVRVPVGARILSSPRRPDWLLSNGCRVLFPGGKAAGA